MGGAQWVALVGGHEGCLEKGGLWAEKPGGDEDRSGSRNGNVEGRVQGGDLGLCLFRDSEDGEASGAGGGCDRVHLPGICRALRGQAQALPGRAQGAAAEGAAYLGPGEHFGEALLGQALSTGWREGWELGRREGVLGRGLRRQESVSLSHLLLGG